MKKQLPDTLGYDSLEILKEGLCEIGACFLKKFHKYQSDPDGLTVAEFMKTYSSILILTEMYSEYDFHQEQLRKAA